MQYNPKKIYRALWSSGTLWALISTALRVGSGVVLIPIVTRLLSKQELGFWYVMSAAGGLSLLVDLGFSPTTLRSVAELRAGACKLSQSGQVASYGKANWDGIVSFCRTTNEIYRYISILACVLYIIGIIYGLRVNLTDISVEQAIAVVLGVASCTMVVLAANTSAILCGLGEIAEANKIIAGGQMLYLLSACILLSFNTGVAGLALSNLLYAVWRYVFTARKVNSIFLTIRRENELIWSKAEVLAAIWPNTWRYGLAAVGSYFIISANTLIVSRQLGLGEVASYGITNQVIGVLTSVSSVFMSSKTSIIVSLLVTKDFDRLRNQFFKCYIMGVFMYLAGAVGVLLAGERLLSLVGSSAELLSPFPLAFFLIYRFLEFNHSQFASLVLAANKMPFLWPAIISGSLIVFGSNFLAARYGIWGVLIVTASVQLACNNWYPIYLGNKILKGLNN